MQVIWLQYVRKEHENVKFQSYNFMVQWMSGLVDWIK